MNSSLRFLPFFLLALAAAWAGPKREESLTLFEGRKVVIAVPAGFNYEAGTKPDGPVVVQLATAQNKVTAELTFLPDPDKEFATMRARAEKMVEFFQEFVESSVEKAMQFEELQPKAGAGTYCVFTDAKLVSENEYPPGEYLHVTAGLKTWPGVATVFKVFSNDTKSAEYQAMMKMLRESVEERVVPLK